MGTVIDVKKDLVIVNAGLKSEGMIPIDQFIGFDGKVEVQEGDTVEVTVDAIEDGLEKRSYQEKKQKKQELGFHYQKLLKKRKY
jgi:small subunit ribosomal protein S1